MIIETWKRPGEPFSVGVDGKKRATLSGARPARELTQALRKVAYRLDAPATTAVAKGRSVLVDGRRVARMSTAGLARVCAEVISETMCGSWPESSTVAATFCGERVATFLSTKRASDFVASLHSLAEVFAEGHEVSVVPSHRGHTVACGGLVVEWSAPRSEAERVAGLVRGSTDVSQMAAALAEHFA